MTTSTEYGNPLKKFKLLFLGEQNDQNHVFGGSADHLPAAVGHCRADSSSFHDAFYCVERVSAQLGSEVIIMLVGNKTDLTEKRQVSTEKGEHKSRELNVMFIETSAKTGYNVKPLFRRVAAALPGMGSEDQEKPKLKDVALGPTKPEPKAASRGCAC